MRRKREALLRPLFSDDDLVLLDDEIRKSQTQQLREPETQAAYQTSEGDLPISEEELNDALDDLISEGPEGKDADDMLDVIPAESGERPQDVSKRSGRGRDLVAELTAFGLVAVVWFCNQPLWLLCIPTIILAAVPKNRLPHLLRVGLGGATAGLILVSILLQEYLITAFSVGIVFGQIWPDTNRTRDS